MTQWPIVRAAYTVPRSQSKDNFVPDFVRIFRTNPNTAIECTFFSD